MPDPRSTDLHGTVTPFPRIRNSGIPLQENGAGPGGKPGLGSPPERGNRGSAGPKSRAPRASGRVARKAFVGSHFCPKTSRGNDRERSGTKFRNPGASEATRASHANEASFVRLDPSDERRKRACKGSGDEVPGSKLEAPPGIEPGMEVLQTSALPLGDGALERKLEVRSEKSEVRNLLTLVCF